MNKQKNNNQHENEYVEISELNNNMEKTVGGGKNNKQFAQEIKKSAYNYNMLDASKNFLYSTLYPLLFSFVFIVLLSLIASLSGISSEKINANVVVKYFSLLLAELVFIGILYFYHKKNKINIIHACKLKQKLDWVKILIVVALSVTTVFLIAPFINLLDYVYTLFNYSPSGSLPFVMDNFFKFILGVIAMAAVPAVAEELLFRGVIFKGLQTKFKPVVAIVLSATFFMLMHGSLQQTVYQFVLGIILATIAYLGGNIVYSMIYHFVNNFIVVLMSYIQTVNHVETTATFKTALDFILPIIYLAVAAGLIVGLLWLFRNYKKLLKNKTTQNVEQSNHQQNPNQALQNATLVEAKGLKQKKLNNAKNEKVQMVDATENSQITTQKNIPLTYTEKVYFYVSIGVAVLMWIVNTVSVYL